MRLPQPLLESPLFAFAKPDALASAMGQSIQEAELQEILRLVSLGLPPITSPSVLATMIGVNKGFVWSLLNRTHRYYRRFKIPKGKGKSRIIVAPRVALKIIQKWLSFHLQRAYRPPAHVFGFVPGRSHVLAAREHCEARWVLSVDIENFFPSTPIETVRQALIGVGYGESSAKIISELLCLNGWLVQGAPSSPVMSNIAFSGVDEEISGIALRHGIRLTRYADDIVFSGTGSFPESLESEVAAAIAPTEWVLARQKTCYSELPARLKVHGLLVHGRNVRLTKGYRNKIRAYRHLLKNGKVRASDVNRVLGHMRYAEHIDSHLISNDGDLSH